MRIRGWHKNTEDIRETFAGDDVAIRDLFLLFWRRRTAVIVSVLFFIVLAIIRIATSPYTYESSSTYISELAASENQVGGGFAELFGLSASGFGQGASGIFSDPGFYPAIIESQAFLRDIMKEEFYFRIYGKTMTLQEFVLQHDSRNALAKWFQPVLALPGRMIKWFERKPDEIDLEPEPAGQAADSTSTVPKKEILRISRAELGAMTKISQIINISVNGNLIEISTTMPDPVVCAKLNALVAERLLDFIVSNETQKERRDLQYVERRVQSAKSNFQQSQRALALFRDQNRGMISETTKTEEEQLQSEYAIDFGIYQKLATDLEEKRIALEEKTPLFTQFEEVYVPVTPTNRGSFRTLVLFMIAGVFIGFCIVIVVIGRPLITGKG